MFYHADEAAVLHFSGESSRTTHGATEAVDASHLFGGMLWAALMGGTKAEILAYRGMVPTTAKIQAIAAGSYQTKSRDDIKGSGYVVAALEAALWCFHNTENYRDAILTAANLGDDADTTAAICGQLAGAFYGKSEIPEKWLARLVMRGEIEQLALDLMAGPQS
jgi:ADP-ribosyl-[dinitrogen reductase] hydrolase